MHFMLQKEVVARMAARPDTRDYGRLTVMLSMACQVEPLFDVGPGAFRPPPQVRSAVVRLVPRSAPLAALADPARFAAIVRQAFSMRRKTLRNSLAGLVDEAAMQAAGVDPERRAGELSPEAFARLAATEAPGSGRRYTSGGAGPE
jgi:16S rRNA (adenine1518-N6/adenine1519-N6)-dimethyltransferase